MKIKKLVKRKRLKYVSLYQSNIILECDETFIKGNIVGDHLIDLQVLPGCQGSPGQWEYLSKVYEVPPLIALSLFGNFEINWLQYCGGHHRHLDFLLSYWTFNGFERMCDDPDDFIRQRHNIDTFLRFPNPEKIHKMTRSHLRIAKTKILQESPAGIYY